ncbi:MAG: flagellar protein FlaG [Spirochaetaceae bacterium]|nr:flagellar protein FlaG [Spirochaetaceae bacterium]
MAWDVAGVSVNGMTGFHGAERPHFQAPHHAAHAPEKRPDTARAQRAIRDIEQFSNFLNRRLKYSVSSETNQVIVKVIDGETDKVIKVLPPEELQRLHSRIRESIGLLFDQTI